MKQDILNLSFGYHCKIYYCVLHKPQDIEVTEPFKIYVLNIKGKKIMQEDGIVPNMNHIEFLQTK